MSPESRLYQVLLDDYYETIFLSRWSEVVVGELVRVMDWTWPRLSVSEQERVLQHAEKLYCKRIGLDR